MTKALALQHNKKRGKIHDMYKTYTIALVICNENIYCHNNSASFTS